MELSKAGLTAMLLEAGEEDLAVMIAYSALPDTIEMVRDRSEGITLGLSPEELEAMLPASGGATTSDDDLALPMEQAISRRWADLVSKWNRG